MGRTNIVLDERLVKQAMQLSGARTKRQAVDLALRELVARRTVYRALRRLKGKLPPASQGITIRGAVDCIVAQTCIVVDAELLTSDGDFTAIARYAPLRLCGS